jgi:hypothetical protein
MPNLKGVKKCRLLSINLMDDGSLSIIIDFMDSKHFCLNLMIRMKKSIRDSPTQINFNTFSY